MSSERNSHWLECLQVKIMVDVLPVSVFAVMRVARPLNDRQAACNSTYPFCTKVQRNSGSMTLVYSTCVDIAMSLETVTRIESPVLNADVETQARQAIVILHDLSKVCAGAAG